MINDKLLLGGGENHTIYTLTVGTIEAEHILGYDKGRFGAVVPWTIEDKYRISQILVDYIDYTFIFTLEPAYGPLYIVRMDNKKGVSCPYNGQWLNLSDLLFTLEDLYNPIELYVSDTLPPFDWENVFIHSGGGSNSIKVSQ